jgi:glycosyltransferase involved in cell wall biosynthesis
VQEGVRFRGQLRGDDLVRAYQHAAVAVLPSRTEAESFGMVLIEAMACGTPVIGSRVGGVPFVVRDGVDGLLVPPADATALAQACTRLLTDERLARSMGDAGREAAVERFSWTRGMAATADIFRAVAGGSPLSPQVSSLAETGR